MKLLQVQLLVMRLKTATLVNSTCKSFIELAPGLKHPGPQPSRSLIPNMASGTP